MLVRRAPLRSIENAKQLDYRGIITHLSTKAKSKICKGLDVFENKRGLENTKQPTREYKKADDIGILMAFLPLKVSRTVATGRDKSSAMITSITAQRFKSLTNYDCADLFKPQPSLISIMTLDECKLSVLVARPFVAP